MNSLNESNEIIKISIFYFTIKIDSWTSINDVNNVFSYSFLKRPKTSFVNKRNDQKQILN